MLRSYTFVMSTILMAGLVATRIASTSWANVVQKRMLHANTFSPIALFAIEWGWMTLLTAPWWLSSWTLGGTFWFWMVLTVPWRCRQRHAPAVVAFYGTVHLWSAG